MFGNLGDMMGMMKKAKEIQGNLKKLQDEMATMEAVGKSQEGHVEAVASGDMSIKKIIINPSLLTTDAEIIQSQVTAAVNNALMQIKAIHQSKMTEVTGGIKIPGLF